MSETAEMELRYTNIVRARDLALRIQRFNKLENSQRR